MSTHPIIAKIGPGALAQPQLAEALSDCLATLQGQLHGLVELADRKLAAIRAADAGRLNQCTRAEADLLQAVAKTEQQRSACVARLAQSLRCPELRQACLSEIANFLPEPHAARLRSKTAGLRDSAETLQQKNRLAARVAQDLQGHIRGIFAAIAKARQETVGYGSTGQMRSQPSDRLMIDAMG